MPKLSASYVLNLYLMDYVRKEGGNSAVTVKDYTISMMKYRQGVRALVVTIITNYLKDYFHLLLKLELGKKEQLAIEKIKGRFNSNNAEFTINLADQSKILFMALWN